MPVVAAQMEVVAPRMESPLVGEVEAARLGTSAGACQAYLVEVGRKADRWEVVEEVVGRTQPGVR